MSSEDVEKLELISTIGFAGKIFFVRLLSAHVIQ